MRLHSERPGAGPDPEPRTTGSRNSLMKQGRQGVWVSDTYAYADRPAENLNCISGVGRGSDARGGGRALDKRAAMPAFVRRQLSVVSRCVMTAVMVRSTKVVMLARATRAENSVRP